MTSATDKALISGTTFSAGTIAVAQPSLVFGTVVTSSSSTLPAIQNAGFQSLYAQSYMAPNGIISTMSTVCGFGATTSDLDVSYSVPNQSVAAGTVAAFDANPSL